MFTGIISAVAPVLESKQESKTLRLSIARPNEWSDLVLGESIAVNGVCLTVAELSEQSFSFQLVNETLSKTSFGQKIPGRVNLERALKVDERLSGHFVLGHVDQVGRVSQLTKDGEDVRLQISYSQENAKLLVEKGSITVDGVALTISNLMENQFEVALIPFTLANTTLGQLDLGAPVNLEFDILGKYVLKSEVTNAAS